MRIGMIALTFPPVVGGMEELARNLAESLSSSDDVTVFSRRDQGAPGAFHVAPCLTGRFRADADQLAAQDAAVDVWLGMQASTATFAAALRRPFAVYCYGNDFLSPWDPQPQAMAARRLVSGAPFLWRYTEKIERAVNTFVVQRALRRTSRVLTISKFSAGLLSRIARVPARRITVAPPGVDEDFFQQHEPQRPGEFRILTVSRLPRNSRKNVDGVIRAIAQLPDLPITYSVVGDGDGRPALEALAKDLGLGSRVQFLGRVDRNTLLASYRQADLFVLAANATKIDVEGFGIAYLEACASGVPVIASAAGGCTEAVLEGVNGLTLLSSEPEAIAAGIRRFWCGRGRFHESRIREVAAAYRWPAVAGRVRQCLADRVVQVQGD